MNTPTKKPLIDSAAQLRANRLVDVAINWLVPIALAVACFLLIVDVNVLNVENVGWLAGGDPAMFYLGWSAFRQSPWTIPPGANSLYGIELASSVIYSDSIPLFALTFKAISGFLPSSFQYFGIWILTCFVAQALMGWRVVGLISRYLLLQSAGTLILLVSPIMLIRMGGHFALACHALLLAAIWLCLNVNAPHRMLRWTALFFVATLIHSYLFAMVLALWISDLWRRRIVDRLTRHMILREIGALAATACLSLWVAGFFVIRTERAGGFGEFKMNLLSLVDCNGWSRLLPNIPSSSNEWEGFNYLGLGVILLALGSIPIACNRRWIRVPERPWRPLAIMCLLLALFAITHRVGVGGTTFEILPLGGDIRMIFDTLRATGRLFWPVYYLAIFGILTVYVRALPRPASCAVIVAACSIQLWDTSAAWPRLRELGSDRPIEPALRSRFWSESASRFQRVRLVPQQNRHPHWEPIGRYAIENGMATDACYFARLGNHVKQGDFEAARAFAEGTLDGNTLYVFTDPRIARSVLLHSTNRLPVRHIDGFYVTTTKSASLQALQPSVALHEILDTVPLGTEISPTSTPGLDAILGLGWQPKDPLNNTDRIAGDGYGGVIDLTIRFSSNNEKQPAGTLLQIQIEISGLRYRHQQQPAEFEPWVNGVPLTGFTVSEKQKRYTPTINLPRRLSEDAWHRGFVHLRLKCVSPLPRNDPRLGLFLHCVRIDHAPAGP